MKQSADKFISKMLRRIEDQTKQLDLTLTANAVTLKRRYRDMSLSDNLDTFKNDVWTNIDARNFYPINIIKPTIKANGSALVSAQIKVDIEPRFTKDSTTQRAAEVARAIRDLKTDEQWSSELQDLIATEIQVAPGVFLWVKHEENAYNPFRAKTPEWGEEESLEGGNAICKDCGYESEEETCEHCGGEMVETDEPQSMSMPVIADVKEVNTGNVVTKVIPFSEIRVDSRRTQGGHLDNARWLEHHYAVPKHEIEDEDVRLGTTAEMSYSLKWQLALETGRDMSNAFSTDQFVDEYLEARDLYLTPSMYRHIEIDRDFEAGDYKCPAGKGFGDGTYEGKPLPEEAVLCFHTVNGTVLDVYPCDFRDELTYVAFTVNPSSFHGLFLTELLPLQDSVNYLNSLMMFHMRRNARTTIVYNSEAFDGEDLEKDIAPTRDGFFVDSQQPISNNFGIIPAVPLSGEPMNHLQMILSYKGDVSGVQPAMTGGDTSEQGYNTYSGQLLAKQQSMAQLSGASLCLARAKQWWVRRQIELAQKHWSEEEFGFLLKLNGEWTEEYIQAFLEANLETDLVIQYAQGSEVPRSLMEREMALRQFMMDLQGIVQMTGQPVGPQVASDILTKLKRMADIDVDVENADEQLHLVDARFDRVKAMLEGIQIPPDADPNAVEAASEQILMSNPDIVPFERENHTAAIEWYTDQYIAESQADEPNHLLLASIRKMIALHESAAVAQAQKETEMQMAAQAPAMEAQQAQAEQAMAQEQEAESQRVAQEQEMKAQEREQQMADQETQRRFEREKALDEAAIRMVEREADAQAQKEQGTGKGATVTIGE